MLFRKLGLTLFTITLLFSFNANAQSEYLMVRCVADDQETSSIGLGRSFDLEVKTQLPEGFLSSDIQEGMLADAYISLVSQDEGWELYMVFDAFGNVTFTSEIRPIVSYWRAETFDWMALTTFMLPDSSPELVGNYSFKAYLVRNGESIEDKTPSVWDISVTNNEIADIDVTLSGTTVQNHETEGLDINIKLLDSNGQLVSDDSAVPNLHYRIRGRTVNGEGYIYTDEIPNNNIPDGDGRITNDEHQQYDFDPGFGADYSTTVYPHQSTGTKSTVAYIRLLNGETNLTVFFGDHLGSSTITIRLEVIEYPNEDGGLTISTVKEVTKTVIVGDSPEPDPEPTPDVSNDEAADIEVSADKDTVRNSETEGLNIHIKLLDANGQLFDEAIAPGNVYYRIQVLNTEGQGYIYTDNIPDNNVPDGTGRITTDPTDGSDYSTTVEPGQTTGTQSTVAFIRLQNGETDLTVFFGEHTGSSFIYIKLERIENPNAHGGVTVRTLKETVLAVNVVR